MLSYFQAIVLGLLQGVTELFPVSSLGHSVILPQLLGWDKRGRGAVRLGVVLPGPARRAPRGDRRGAHDLLSRHLGPDHPRRPGLARDAADRDADQRLGWLLVVATIPAGIVGLLLEHPLRVVFAKPLAAAGFLVLNGLILLAGEWVRRRAQFRVAGPTRHATRAGSHATPAGRRLDDLGFPVAATVGVAQAFALLPGISRSGITMVAGLVRGLDHQDAARFSFLLATPVILAAGVYKLPDLLGPNGDGVRLQVVAGSVAAGVAAYVSVRFLARYFTSRTLTPFAIYCLVVGVLALFRFA